MIRHICLVLSIVALCASRALAQDPAASPVTPSFEPFGFADIVYSASERHTSDGFALGQAVGHLSGVLTTHLVFFGEATATARDNGFAVEVERLIVRYDFNDLLKISAGRFHTGTTYWNTAFHHGLWLQTSIARPELIRFGSQVVPVHFVGAMVEGTALPATLGLNYAAGVGNGRGAIISRAGDAGDANAQRAWTASVFLRPPAVRGLQVGGAVYADRVPGEGTPSGTAIRERIASAHVALTRGTPEIIAEYVRLWHALPGESWIGNNTGYVQLAWRLPESALSLKPYARWERNDIVANDPLFGGTHDYEAIIGGARWDFVPYAALKAEYRREKLDGGDRVATVALQISVALAGTHGT